METDLNVRPIKKSEIELVITYVLGLITFVAYTHWFGIHELHEPAISDKFGGDPLNFMDLFNLILLIYIVYFNSWPFKSS